VSAAQDTRPMSIDDAMTALTVARSSRETLAALEALAAAAQAEAARVRARIVKAVLS
jgi:hypothetical protein